MPKIVEKKAVKEVKEVKEVKQPKKYTFKEYFTQVYLKEVDLTKKHNPDAHGVLGAVPSCGLCDKSLPTVADLYNAQA